MINNNNKVFVVDIFRIIELCTVENICLAELQEDAQFNKIPAGDVRNFVDRIIKIATGKADDIKTKLILKQKQKLKKENEKEYNREYKSENKKDNENDDENANKRKYKNEIENKRDNISSNFSLEDVCASKGVSVNLIEGTGAHTSGRFRAEIYYDEKIINIMKRSIDQMYDVLKIFVVYFGDNKRFISADNIKNMHIAHELYHLIEFTDGEYTPDLLPAVTSINIFGFERKKSVSKASEAAAHIFCMRLLDLPFHPKLLDYLCLLAAGEVRSEKLIEFLEEIQMLTARFTALSI
jgi:hypothetical protein